jgi:hypothetical protein
MRSEESVARGIRIRRAEDGAWSTMETRVALIVAERGITKKQLAKYWVSRRKNCKPRFDYWAFAKAQDISTDWLFDGDIRAHPRGNCAPRPHQPRLTDGDAA